MPTVFTHAAVAFAISKLILAATNHQSTEAGSPEPSPAIDEPPASAFVASNKPILLAAAILGALPDADALYRHSVVQRELFGHRGFTHSLSFAALMGLVLAILYVKLRWNHGQKLWTLALIFSLATASHGFFDAMTTGGSGVAFFAPFDNTRHFFAFRPIPVAPFSAAALISARGLNLLVWEFALLWTFVIGAILWRHRDRMHTIAALVCWLVCLGMWLWKL